MKGWKGRDFKDKAECDAFDPKTLLGKACRITLVENGEYTNIESISPLDDDDKKKMPKQVNKSVFFSLEPDEFDKEVFESLGKSTQEKIAKSPEYVALTGGGEADGGSDNGDHGQSDDDGAPPSDSEPF